MVLVGGSRDGVELTFADEVPPPIVLAAEPPPITSLLHGDGPSFIELVYEPAVDALGCRSRDDRGRWRYRYVQERRGAPVTSEDPST